jgi:hypothetical protein
MGQIKERLLLVPLKDGLLCAAFTEDGIPERPTHQEPRRIRVMKRRESSPEKKRPPRGPQPPMAMTPSLQAAPSSIIPWQSQPEQRQGVYFPQDAVRPTQGYFSNFFYDGREHGRCGHFSDRTNASAMGIPAQPMLSRQSQSQLRAQQRRLRRYGEYNGVTPRQTRPCRQVLQASRPRDDVPAFLRLAGTNPGPLISQNYIHEVLPSRPKAVGLREVQYIRLLWPGHGDIHRCVPHTHFIAVPRSTYVQESM